MARQVNAGNMQSYVHRVCRCDESKGRNQVHSRRSEGCIQGARADAQPKHKRSYITCTAQIFEGAAPKDHIRVVDLVDNLLRFGEKPLTKEQAQDLVGQLEADGNGLVNYVDFVNMMLTK